MVVRSLRLPAFVASVLLAACHDDPPVAEAPDDDGAPSVVHGHDATPPAVRRDVEGIATFSPRQVASLALVLNRSEIEVAELASARAETLNVRGFGRQLARDHGAIADTLEPAATRLGGRATEPSAAVVAQAASTVAADLAELDGEAFDLAFATLAVERQARTLALIERSLRPSLEAARGDDARAFLGHLDGLHARAEADLEQALRLHAWVVDED